MIQVKLLKYINGNTSTLFQLATALISSDKSSGYSDWQFRYNDP